MPHRLATRICLEGWYYLVVVLFIVGGAVLGGVNLLIVLAGMMIGPFLFNWRCVQVTLRDLQVSRRLAERVGAGEVLTVAISARNRRASLTSWAIMVEDSLARMNGPNPSHRPVVRVLLPRVPAGESCTGLYRMRLFQRGRYALGPLRVSTRFPLGLVRASTALDATDSFLVYPLLGRLTQRWTQVVNSQFVGNQGGGRRQGMLEGDYYGLREWRNGDSRRWIHWRTSAKLGELSVRQFEQQRNRDLILVLDLWQPEQPTPEQLAVTEVAISFLASGVVDICKREGSRLVLGIVGRESMYWSGPASSIMAQDVLDHLSEVLPGDGQGLRAGLEHVCRYGATVAPALVISTRAASASNRAADTRPANRSRGLGDFTWIDCRGEDLRHYFVPSASPTYRGEPRTADMKTDCLT